MKGAGTEHARCLNRSAPAGDQVWAVVRNCLFPNGRGGFLDNHCLIQFALLSPFKLAYLHKSIGWFGLVTGTFFALAKLGPLVNLAPCNSYQPPADASAGNLNH
eukprot:867404-Pelagomonas_calceolata.AAC.1